MTHPREPGAARMRGVAVAMLVGLGALLAGCGERAQELQAKVPDQTPWAGKPTAYAGSGWSGGDKAAWEQQIRTRNQGQNEYNRAPATRP